jgi:hypothetical protein
MLSLTNFLDSINLKLFNQHYSVIAFTAVACHVLFSASFQSHLLFGKRYSSMSQGKKIDWGTRVVSHVFACLVVVWSAFLYHDQVLNKDRLFGYTYNSGNLMAVAIGYVFNLK